MKHQENRRAIVPCVLPSFVQGYLVALALSSVLWFAFFVACGLITLH